MIKNNRVGKFIFCENADILGIIGGRWNADSLGDENRAQIIQWFRSKYILHQGKEHIGVSPLRRLTRYELQNTLEDQTGRWILDQHEEGHSEYPLTGYINNRFVNRILDRTFVDRQGVRWIIDYKTGEHQGADLEHYFE